MRNIQLIDTGRVTAKPAGEFNIGNKMLWNYDSSTEVLSIIKISEHFNIFTLLGSDGSTHERKLKNTRLIGFAQ
jgi:hypothetical protein